MSTTGTGKLSSATIIVVSSIVISRITGFIREMLVPNMIGFNQFGDAYNLAFKITGLMYDLLVGGTIAAALIPVLASYIAKEDEKEGWKAIGTFINIVIVAGVLITVIGIVAAPFFIPKIAVGFSSAEQKELTVRITQILFPSVGFLMLAGLMNGILNSYHKFAASSYGPVVYNLGSALSILLLSSSKSGIRAVAYGVMGSAVIYFAFQLFACRKNLKYYKFEFHLKHPGFLRLCRLAIPSMLSSSIVQVNVIISNLFVTLFPVGSVTAFNLADRTWQMPYGVFAQGIGIAMLPTLSAKIAKNQIKEFKDTLSRGLKMALLVLMPSAVGFVTLREPIIRTIFQFTSKVDENAVALAGNLLMFFSIALISQSIVTILNRAFYANNDSKTPLYIGVFTIIFNVGISFILYKTTSIGVSGMALAYSLASVLNAVLLIFLLGKKMQGIYLDKLLTFVGKIIPSTVAMGVLLLYLSNVVPPFVGSKLVQLTVLFLEIALGAGVYFGLALLFKVEEAIYAKGIVINKVTAIWRRISHAV